MGTSWSDRRSAALARHPLPRHGPSGEGIPARAGCRDRHRARHLKFNPEDPTWFDRDRFVLSAGHGSMLLYALLHLRLRRHAGRGVVQLRSWAALRSPDATLSAASRSPPARSARARQCRGMAVAGFLAAQLNGIVDHRSYAIVGDGCLQEGGMRWRRSPGICGWAAGLALGRRR
jgi:transketolase